MFKIELEPKIVQKAFKLAEKVHNKQFRKDKKTPYITHPISVMNIALNVHKSYLMNNDINYNTTEVEVLTTMIKVVALLHDTVEDAQENHEKGLIPKKDVVTLKDIEKKFGEKIANCVDNLTKRHGEEYDETVLRATFDIISHFVKIADNIHNASSLDKKDPIEKHRRRTYLMSRRFLMSLLGIQPENYKILVGENNGKR